jgi:hypothetical protein
MDRYEELVQRGYWVGGVSASRNLCTCKGITRDDYGEVHSKFCPRWKPEWVRRGSTKDITTK